MAAHTLQSLGCQYRKPFLKWPGGKSWLAPHLVELIRGELTGTYIEPFLGSAAVFLRLSPRRAILSDCNAALIRALRTIRDHPHRVVDLAWRFSNTEDCYYRVRRMRPKTATGFAARFLFLNRTCWGGIYRLNRHGEFNVPFGNSGRRICHKGSLIAAATSFKKAALLSADFEDVVGKGVRGDVVYVDPPYTTRGQNNGFIRYNERLFSWADQVRLAAACKRAAKRGAFVIISGPWHRDILKLYPGWWAGKLARRSTVSRDVEGRKKVSEVLLFSRRPRVSMERVCELSFV